MFMQPAEWRKAFENKTESEISALEMPPGLPHAYANLWRRDRDEMLARLRPSPEPDDIEDEEDEDDDMPSFSEQKRAVEDALTALENDTSGIGAPVQSVPSQPLEIPKGNVADLLEHQIGMCSALIGNIANYIARNETATDVCFPFMDRISSMLSSSATAARVVGQLRGIASETKQTFITEKGGKGAGGVPQS